MRAVQTYRDPATGRRFEIAWRVARRDPRTPRRTVREAVLTEWQPLGRLVAVDPQGRYRDAVSLPDATWTAVRADPVAALAALDAAAAAQPGYDAVFWAHETTPLRSVAACHTAIADALAANRWL